jgi:ribosome maturation factor RimP
LSDIEEMVEEAKSPGKFNIVDAVRGRAYPKNTVDVFIDEELAFNVRIERG